MFWYIKDLNLYFPTKLHIMFSQHTSAGKDAYFVNNQENLVLKAFLNVISQAHLF